MKKGKVLIADGSIFMRIILTTALQKLGFEVVGTAQNGNEAVDKYREQRPDIVLMDVKLRDIGGIEATRNITNGDSSAVVIVLIEESFDIPDIIVEAVRAGAKGYMRKPLSAEKIEAHIESALKRS